MNRLGKLLLLFTFFGAMAVAKASTSPVTIGVIGLTHTHVHWIFGSQARGDFEIVGIVEPNQALARRYAEQHQFSMSLVYPTMEAMFEEVNPQAVTAFGSIYEHLEVVEAAAPRGIHVMVEKPLAVNMKHAKRMQSLAKQHGIHLLTNYETTWYPSVHESYRLAKQEQTIGALRKIIVNDGHRGPKKIGVNEEFLSWLTDPVENGGGAVVDFGCYGANLLTWFMHGERPYSVTAMTKQLQPENNPKVDDESIILLEYDSLVAVIQGSWNWPMGRKDMEIYGLKGALYADNRQQLRQRIAIGYDGFDEQTFILDERPAPFDDPFAYMVAVINKEIALAPHHLSALENNMLVVEILDAARKSARKKKTMRLKP